MFELDFTLKSINDVYDFVLAMQSVDCDLDLMTDQRRFIVDAKSVMGVFSLDLSRPLVLKAYTDDAELCRELTEDVKKIAGAEILNNSYTPSHGKRH